MPLRPFFQKRMCKVCDKNHSGKYIADALWGGNICLNVNGEHMSIFRDIWYCLYVQDIWQFAKAFW